MKSEIDFELKLVSRENLPLYGKRVLFTTPRNYAGILGKLLLERGARTVWMPTIEIWPMPDYRELDQAIINLPEYDWIGFTSENGIEAFCTRLIALGFDRQHIKKTGIAAFRSDAKAFDRWGINADLLPEESSPKGIIDELRSRGVKGKKIMVPVPEVSGVKEPYVVPEFIKDLQGLGMVVQRIDAYQTIAVRDGLAVEKKLLLAGDIDIIVLTSSAEIFSLLEHVDNKLDVLNKATIAYMGKFTSKTGGVVGLHQDIVPEKYTMRGLLEAMEAHFKK